MGIAERKDKQKKALREKIIATATSLFLDKGFEKTSIRTIAEKIEYSPATIYLYFKDKNELFYVIMERSFRNFFDYLNRYNTIPDPMERLQALGKAYLQFATDYPLNYDLMFVVKAPMQTPHTTESWENGMKSHDILRNAVTQCIEEGHFKGHDPESLSLTIWSTVHGLCTLKIRSRLKMYPENRQSQLIKDALDALNKMIEKA